MGEIIFYAVVTALHAVLVIAVFATGHVPIFTGLILVAYAGNLVGSIVVFRRQRSDLKWHERYGGDGE